MNIKIFIVLIAALLSACDTKNKIKTETVVYNSNVREAIGQYEKELVRQRNEIVFENGAKAKNCDSYIKASMASRIGEGVNNQIIKGDYLVCDVLLLLGHATYISPKSKPEFGKILAQQVDLRSFPSSHVQMLDDKKHTLVKLSDKLNIGATTVNIDSNDWFYGFELVATTDVNKNGKADWIIWFVDEAKTGNYRGYQTLVAYDVDKNKGLIKLQPFPN